MKLLFGTLFAISIGIGSLGHADATLGGEYCGWVTGIYKATGASQIVMLQNNPSAASGVEIPRQDIQRVRLENGIFACIDGDQSGSYIPHSLKIVDPMSVRQTR